MVMASSIRDYEIAIALCEQMLGPEHPDEIGDGVRSPVRNVRNDREHHERALSIAQDKTAAHKLFARAGGLRT